MIKNFCLLSLWLSSLMGFSQPVTPVILDTDIGPDYDDVGALALLHALEDLGEAKILATISCNAFETTGPTLSVLNTYFRRPDIPIGIVKNSVPYETCRQHWAQAIIRDYPHALQSNGNALEAVGLYRKILSSRADKSVTIITIGFFTNLANLLNSKGDEFSSLTGKELVFKKVKQLVSMAAGIGKDGRSAHEFNVRVDAEAARKVLAEWPTPILLSGFEIGEKILTGARLIRNEDIKQSPVKDSYQIALAADNNPAGRNSWDQTAVLVAIRGYALYFNSRKVNFEIKDDGRNVLVPGESFTYLTEKMPFNEVAKVIEDLMMHQPTSP
jgi:inosine-uridine nucleoside N-ribohydrolase